MAKTISHRELRNHSSDVLRRVQAGETIQVTNHGEVVAVLSPLMQRLRASRRRCEVAGRLQVDPSGAFGRDAPGCA